MIETTYKSKKVPTLTNSQLLKGRAYIMLVDRDGRDLPNNPAVYQFRPTVVMIAESSTGLQVVHNLNTGLCEFINQFVEARFLECDMNMEIVS